MHNSLKEILREPLYLPPGAGRVRALEAACCARMNQVRAANMALQFSIVPVSAFVTFTVVCPASVFTDLERSHFSQQHTLGDLEASGKQKATSISREHDCLQPSLKA